MARFLTADWCRAVTAALRDDDEAQSLAACVEVRYVRRFAETIAALPTR